MSGRFRQIFSMPKPIIGMLHLAGATPAERLDLAKRETATLVENGVDCVIVENYYCDKTEVRPVLDWLAANRPPALIGVNVLRDYRLAFELAETYDVDFIQIDSVAGHLPPEEDNAYADELAERRARVRAALFGGVRFKYQPIKSGRSEAEDLAVGRARCDALVVTGDATGEPTDLEKIRRFRSEIGADFPLLVGAGVTPSIVAEQLRIADGAIIGSYFKDTHAASGVVLGAHVEEIMRIVRDVREETAAK